MIKVTKGAAPAVLGRLGPGHVKSHSDLFDAEPAAYLAGDKKISIATHVYGDEEVRAALAVAQHGKCCFCEVEIEHPYMHRHVEHWRPKGGVRQTADGADLHPGYYWLAYDWDNLFLACVVCNSTHKGTTFPLEDPAMRARSHNDALDAETPMLLKPDVDDPADHIEWIDDQPRGLTERGWHTIDAAGLIRQDDVKRTRRFLALRQAYDRLQKIHTNTDPTVMQIAADYRRELQDSVLPTSPFSAMARAYLDALPPAP